MDQVRPGHRDTRSAGSVDQIHPKHPDPPKIISRCSKAFIGPLSIRFNNEDYEDFLKSNKLEPLKAPIRPPQALLLTFKDSSTNRYS